MAIDIARTSFDPARHYTSVAPQQGRVTLEADENEERDILVEESRAELIDIVGPAGTPDNGYAVSAAPNPFDFTVGPGTMYVGGNRVELDAPILYSDQPDWLDHEGDPEFAVVNDEFRPEANEHVVLVLTETDVTATEDPVLREVALGGPDTAARTRLLQRVHRLEARGDDCAEALQLDEELWWPELGVVFDPETMELKSNGRLLVEWEPPETPPDPCQPSAKGGYLGAENQAIRVQIASVDRENDTFDLLWGWDNASFLYRVTADDSTNPVLTLERSPVDDFHRPGTGQAVQVLRSAAELASTDGVVEGYAASLDGEAAVLAAPYDPDTKTVPLPAPLPAEYTDPNETPQLYLRVWEELLTGHKQGDEIALGGTGVNVVLTVEGGGPFHRGDYWTIAVRPSTPDTVLPARLLRTPQPPNGPRMWACPLAVIGWDDGELEVLDDCRHPFDPLVDQHGGDCCCTVSVTPEDVKAHGLQELVDQAVAGRPTPDRAHRVTICIRPGRYELERPLQLQERHGHLHLEGCGEGVVLEARKGHEEHFDQGLIVLVGADNVRISGIELRLPQTPAVRPEFKLRQRELQHLNDPLIDVFRNLFVSIGIRPVDCSMLEVERCLFRYTVGDPVDEDGLPRFVFGVGVFASSECLGLSLERNRFLHEADDVDREAEDEGDIRERLRFEPILVGLLAMPNFLSRSHIEGSHGLREGSFVRAALSGARIRDNEFTGLTAAIAVIAEVGDVRIEDNTARRCYSGIWIVALRAYAFTDLTGTFRLTGNVEKKETVDRVRAAFAATANPLFREISSIGRTYPLPAHFVTTAPDHVAARPTTRKKAKFDHTGATHEFLARTFEPFLAEQPQTDELEEPAAEAEAAETTFRFHASTAKTPRELATRELHDALNELDRSLILPPLALRQSLELRASHNDVQCSRLQARESGPALVVWSTEVETLALASDNTLIASGRFPTALVLGVNEVVAGGNFVLNTEKSLSLAVLTAVDVAAAGNILVGVPFLPPGLQLNTIRV